jgi:hypothetical protein
MAQKHNPIFRKPWMKVLAHTATIGGAWWIGSYIPYRFMIKFMDPYNHKGVTDGYAQS